jgi:hypothetical protein
MFDIHRGQESLSAKVWEAFLFGLAAVYKLILLVVKNYNQRGVKKS